MDAPQNRPTSLRDLAASPLLQGLEHPHALFPVLVTMSTNLQVSRLAQERNCQWRVGTIQRLNGRPRSSTERAVHARGWKRFWGSSGLGSSANPEPDPSPVDLVLLICFLSAGP